MATLVRGLSDYVYLIRTDGSTIDIQHVSRVLWLMTSPFIQENSCRCLVTFDKWQIYYTGTTYVKLIAFHEWLWGTPVQAVRYKRQTRRAHPWVRARGNLHALKCTRVSSYRSHTFTHAHARTYIWRAAHLANRPHYTGGWSIDPSVEELKKSPFSSPPSRMCDMMSWSYLPALCGMTANLTHSDIT